MVRRQRKRISYVLPLANSAGGHRLGINGLAVDSRSSILYSGGRDGVICAWNLDLPLLKEDPFDDDASAASIPSFSLPPARRFPASADQEPSRFTKPPTTLRHTVQAHTHWINDLVLTRGGEALVSASSDISVKVWRPTTFAGSPPQTIGVHSDYVKCLASPGPAINWVASGGLDKKVCLWDLSGAGEVLKINVDEEETGGNKGSVYALAATGSIVACGGPESVVRVWDARSGRRITKFVGHTDNIRSVLLAQDGETVISASSDQTIKLWSLTAGRCMYTLTMHNDSVWSLFSDHPTLGVFWSSDRSGIVAKTDVRGKAEVDDGLCISVCQEGAGVNRVVAAGGYVWTATSSSSLNRWRDVATENAEVLLPDSYALHQRGSITTVTRVRHLSGMTQQSTTDSPRYTNSANRNSILAGTNLIPFRSILRISNTAPFPERRFREADTATLVSAASTRRQSGIPDPEYGTAAVPMRNRPDQTIEGQHGLMKHVMLNDKKRVLTLDTAGEVILWDILKCVPVQSFGKRDIDDVLSQVNTMETVAHWCSVDTRTGCLTCVLEENNCFDAEMYADELDLDEEVEFKEDQRINLGKWILRYLFDNLIDEEIQRDESYRKQLFDSKNPGIAERQRAPIPGPLKIPQPMMTSWLDTSSTPNSASTLKPANGYKFPQTPGLAIGFATPGPIPPMPPLLPLDDTNNQETGSSRNSSERHSSDYFTSKPQAPGNAPVNAPVTPGPPMTPGVNGGLSQEQPATPTPQPPAAPTSEAESTSTPEKSGLFSKKFMRMNLIPKSLKKAEKPAEPKTPAPQEQQSDNDSRNSHTHDKLEEESFLGAIMRARQLYDDQPRQSSERENGVLSTATASTENEAPKIATTLISPSPSNETPVLKPPAQTIILIQEDSVDAGGVADLWEGTVATVGRDADIVERVAPAWLADVLLRNLIPPKEIVKVSFVLEPWQNLLPQVSTDGNTRLNANRMLRAKKILAYVAERVEPAPVLKEDEEAMKAEEYLELYCHDQLIPPTMTLATIRAHVWRGGGDVLLYYKANGRKEIAQVSQLAPEDLGSSEA